MKKEELDTEQYILPLLKYSGKPRKEENWAFYEIILLHLIVNNVVKRNVMDLSQLTFCANISEQMDIH